MGILPGVSNAMGVRGVVHAFMQPARFFSRILFLTVTTSYLITQSLPVFAQSYTIGAGTTTILLPEAQPGDTVTVQATISYTDSPDQTPPSTAPGTYKYRAAASFITNYSSTPTETCIQFVDTFNSPPYHHPVGTYSYISNTETICYYNFHRTDLNQDFSYTVVINKRLASCPSGYSPQDLTCILTDPSQVAQPPSAAHDLVVTGPGIALRVGRGNPMQTGTFTVTTAGVTLSAYIEGYDGNQTGTVMVVVTGACPAGESYNSITQACDCNANAARDPATGQCVACPVDDLKELKNLNAELSENDPDTLKLEDNPINLERLDPRMKPADRLSGYLCLKDAVQAAGVPFNLTSAFRTDAYQRHLWEIWKKWRRLSELKKPHEIQACQARKKKIEQELDKHGLRELGTAPAYDAGKHPQGLAIDVSRKTTMKQLEARFSVGVIKSIADGCNLAYPLPILDRGHFEYKLTP